MTNASISLRPATLADAELLFHWANDPVVRANSFTTGRIPWPDHIDWLERKLSQPGGCAIVIGEDRASRPIGQVRFDIDAGRAVLSVIVDAEFRGRGIGPRLIALATRELLATRIIDEIVAFTRPENEASQRALESAGFIAAGPREVRGQLALAWRFAAEALQ
jgi:RimJ/RimL family protein N-acetyltransferase